jgi:hypothetical protein
MVETYNIKTGKLVEPIDVIFHILEGMPPEEAIKMLSFALAAVAHNVESIDPNKTTIDLVCEAVKGCYLFLDKTDETLVH